MHLLVRKVEERSRNACVVGEPNNSSDLGNALVGAKITAGGPKGMDSSSSLGMHVIMGW